MKKTKIGLYAGGLEQYWTETGMKELPGRIDRDAKRLAESLGAEFEVVYPGLAANVTDSVRVGKAVRAEDVDLALMYHASYLDDAMSLAFLDELGSIFPVLFLSQGIKTFTADLDVTDFGRAWGNNSTVQLPGTLERTRPDLRYGFVFGGLDSPRALEQIGQYARAARAVRDLKGKLLAFFPHRSLGVPMYDTFPDESKVIGQTGMRIDYLYTIDLVKEMEAVSDKDNEALVAELYAKCEVVEPSKEEVAQSARVALGLERLVAKNGVDALAIDFAAGMVPHIGAFPCVGMSRLSDKGIVVTTEGDVGVAVSGLLIKSLTGKAVHFWEHLGFDEENDWIIGGHEGGSAGFDLAKSGTRAKLRATQYINFDGIPGAPHFGVIPEFITHAGPVTLVTFFRGPDAYEMRIARGESVDLDPLPVRYEHTVFKPCIPLEAYFQRIADVSVCHHFALVQAEIVPELLKIAQIMDVHVEDLTE